MALTKYPKEHPYLTQYLNNLIELLNKASRYSTYSTTQEEVLPLCEQHLGKGNGPTQQLHDAGKSDLASEN